ncbi:glycosyltransferase family 2 protein [Halobaculum sp. MBLA0143]|uniref:glycosyltransferase family 2 protein n=1 Tax=Halobaculum sp. MBLA0143 TaxID=3079933 RepID=UPI0035247758
MSVDEPHHSDQSVTTGVRGTPEQTAMLVDEDSDTEPVLTVVMPTLNEEAGIEECITRVKNAVVELGVPTEIVVSDSSTDRTPEIAREMGARVVEPDRDGYGYAYQYGFEHARGEYIAMGDADTTYDFEQLPQLYREVADGDADLVLGSRFEGEIKSGAMPPLHQYLGNPALTAFLNVFYGSDISDAHSGFRVFTAEALDQMSMESTGMEFASEMLMSAVSEGLEVDEVPITYHEREGEATLDSFSDGWRHVKFMLANAPRGLFSVPGLVMSLLGTTIMALGYAETQLFGHLFGLHSTILGSLLLLVGTQVGAFGYYTGLASSPIQDPSGPISDIVRSVFSLERGLLVGAMLMTSGVSIAGYLLYRWADSGFNELPAIASTIVAYTLILIGVQAFFSSFFVDILRK